MITFILILFENISLMIIVYFNEFLVSLEGKKGTKKES